MGWSELAATNAPVEDEPVQPVLRMNILLAGGVFFFHLFSAPPTSPLLSPLLPPQSYLPPTSPLRTPPPPHSIARARVVERKLELWSCCCGVRAGARAPTRPTRPRLGKMLTFLFYFCVCFVWRGIAVLRCSAAQRCNFSFFFFSFFFFLFFFVFFFFSFFFVFFFFSFFFFRKEGDGSAFYFLCWAAAQL